MKRIIFALAMLAALPASATVFTFDFNSLADNANNAAVQTYMRTIVAGTNVSGAGASKTYNGDGFVIGPTLGPDTFIRNVGGDRFSFDFGALFHITALSFDWEIFPDGTCFKGPGDSNATKACAAQGSSNPNWPDFDLYVDGSSTSSFSRVAIATGSNPNYPQAIGTSGVINLADGHLLTFVDWPATIGIDNLVVTGCIDTAGVKCLNPNPTGLVPEPGTLVLFGLALCAVVGIRKMNLTAAVVGPG